MAVKYGYELFMNYYCYYETIQEPFGCTDKPAEKHRWLICCERKIMFRLKKKNKLKRRIISSAPNLTLQVLHQT
jgi:hypothetical protein